MKLKTRTFSYTDKLSSTYTYYDDVEGVMQFHGLWKLQNSGVIKECFIYYNHVLHGESVWFDDDGVIRDHRFYINHTFHPGKILSEEEKLLFKIEHPDFKFLTDFD